MANETVIKEVRIRATSEGLSKLKSDLEGVAVATEKVGVATEKTSRAELSAQKVFDRRQRQFDMEARHAKESANLLRDIERFKQQRIGTGEDYNRMVAGMAHRHEAASRAQKSLVDSTKLSRYEMINLSRQIQDVGVGLASGQSPFTVLVQQGTQIADVFASSGATFKGFVSQFVQGAGSLLTPLRLVAGGVVGIGAGALVAATQWQSAQSEIERALLGIGRRAGATTQDINRIASGASSLTGLSTSEARNAVLEFIKTGDIYKQNIQGLTEVTKNFAITIGKDVPDAAKILAQAMSDPVEGAEQLNRVLGFLDGQVRQQIQSFVEAGARQSAIALIIEKVRETTASAANTVGFFGKVWTVTSNAISEAGEKAGSALSTLTGIGQSTNDQLDQLVARQQQVQEQLRSLGGGPLRGLGADAARSLNQELAKLGSQIATLRLKSQADEASALAQQFAEVARRVDDVTRALIPQIDQLRNLRSAQAALERARRDPEVGDRQRPDLAAARDEASRAVQLQIALVEDARSKEEARTRAVLQIRDAYKGVTTEVALQLNQLDAQIRATEALGSAARLRAQEEATIAQLAPSIGTDEARLVAQRQISLLKAEEVASAREALHEAEAQLRIALETTTAGRLQVQYEEEIAAIRRRYGGNQAAIAAQEAAADARRRASLELINRAVEDQAKAIMDNIRLERELQRAREASSSSVVGATEEMVRGAHAYRQAIEAGADHVAAAAARSAAVAQHTQEASNAATRLANEYERAALAADESAMAARRASEAPSSLIGTRATIGIDATFEPGKQLQLAQGRGSGAAIASLLNQAAIQTWINTQREFMLRQEQSGEAVDLAIKKVLTRGGGFQEAIDELQTRRPFGGEQSSQFFSQLHELYELLNRTTTDTNQQIINLQRELAFLESQPISLERERAIASLIDSINGLQRSTDNLAETNQSILSQLYTTDPRTSRLGFRAGSGVLNYDPFKLPAPNIAPPTALPTTGTSTPTTTPTTTPSGPNPTWGTDPMEWLRQATTRTNTVPRYNFFADGGIAGPWTSGTIAFSDSSQQMAGGVTSATSLAVFGEGSTPEAYVPVPSGKIPVHLMVQGGQGGPQELGDVRPPKEEPQPIQYNINMIFQSPISRDMAAEMRMTVYQSMQQMAGQMGGGV